MGETIHKLCEGRIGVRSKPQSVKLLSRRLGVTRARVYQLLADCAKAFAVRWPQGHCQLDTLAERYAEEAPEASAARRLNAARSVFYPDRSQAADSDEE